MTAQLLPCTVRCAQACSGEVPRSRINGDRADSWGWILTQLASVCTTRPSTQNWLEPLWTMLDWIMAHIGETGAAVPCLKKRLIHETVVSEVDHASHTTQVGRPLFCDVLRPDMIFRTKWPTSPSMSCTPPKPTCSRGRG